MKKGVRDILIRAAKTFIEAFLAHLSIDALFGITDFSLLKKAALGILVGAIAAGITALWNALLDWINSRIDEMDEEEKDDAEKVDE